MAEFKLTQPQAEYIRDLVVEDKRPDEVAKAFYGTYPRAQFENLWVDRRLIEPDLFFEGCELADSAMRVLGDVITEGDKEYLKTSSPFYEAMRRRIVKEGETFYGKAQARRN